MFSARSASAGWFDANWAYRRPIDVTWDAEHATGDELAYAEFYTAGHALPNGDDVRVATDEGRLVASHVLMTGPGDRMRVVFAPIKGERKYCVYFGNPNPAPPPKGFDDVGYRSGLLMEMKTVSGLVHANSAAELKQTWDEAKTLVGRTYIATAFLGVNPFGDQRDVVSKLSGWIFAPLDGEYLFAAAADNRGAVFIDGKSILFAPDCPADIRHNTTLHLTRGRHEFVFYHVSVGGNMRFSVGWRPPSMKTVDVIPRDAFGVTFRGVVGGLEAARKTLTADFKLEYMGECFYENHYSHRYHFAVVQPKGVTAPISAEWLFGDGQTSTAKEIDHVYLTDGVYPIRLTVHVGTNTDTQTNSVVVSRDYERIASPPTDEPPVQAKIVATYDVAKMPLNWLAWGAILERRAQQPDASIVILQRMTSETTLPDVEPALTALRDASQDLAIQRRAEEAIALWDRIPKASNLQPKAAVQYAQFLLWWAGDFTKAVAVLEPFAKSDDKQIRRLYGEALVFAGQAEKGAKVLREVTPEGDLAQQVVMSGAMARNVENCIDENDWENGEDIWEHWQSHYPEDFLEGYSVLLRTKLMEARKCPEAAARVAEAFALAVPKSSYAPQLLDRASKLLERINAQKSANLRALLREKYPEDPLSQ